MSTRMAAQIKRHEGLRLRPYKCSAGKLTIGYGRNLDDVGISQTEADLMLENDIRRAVCEAEALDYFDSLNEPRQAVMVNLVFNMGLPRLMGFKKMHAALRAGDYEEASRQLLDSRYASQVGARALELAGQMRQGCW